MDSLTKKIGPDIKSPFLNEVPTLPRVMAIIPIVMYASLFLAFGYLAFYWYQVRQLEAQYPLDVQEVDRLEASIATHKTEIAKAQNYYKTFLKWRGWINESRPLSPFISIVLQSIAKDVRINYLDLSRLGAGPNQIKLTLRVALTTTAPTKQFDILLNNLDQQGYSVAGGIEENIDTDGSVKYPTPNGLPREVFQRLDVTLEDKNALPLLPPRPEIPVGN